MRLKIFKKIIFFTLTSATAAKQHQTNDEGQVDMQMFMYFSIRGRNFNLQFDWEKKSNTLVLASPNRRVSLIIYYSRLKCFIIQTP